MFTIELNVPSEWRVIQLGDDLVVDAGGNFTSPVGYFIGFRGTGPNGETLFFGAILNRENPSVRIEGVGNFRDGVLFEITIPSAVNDESGVHVDSDVCVEK